MLTCYLGEALVTLNPGLPQEAYQDAIRQITAYSLSQSPLQINQEKHDLLRDGIRVSFRDDTGELVKRRLQVFDFDEPTNNHFLEEIIAEYNREKDRATIEKTFEELLKFISVLDKESTRVLREGLDEETLTLFDLLKKPELPKKDLEWLKQVAAELLAKLKSRQTGDKKQAAVEEKFTNWFRGFSSTAESASMRAVEVATQGVSEFQTNPLIAAAAGSFAGAVARKIAQDSFLKVLRNDLNQTT